MTFCKALRNLEGAYRVARSIIALIMRVGEVASAAERTAGKVLPLKLMLTVQLTQIARMGHDQRPHRSTPNLSTLQRFVSLTPKTAKRWSLPSLSLHTV